MGILNLQKTQSIDDCVNEFNQTDNAVLLDVRTPEEYAEGHIEGSRNIPLDEIACVQDIIRDKQTSLYVYCLSGGRSGRAVAALRQMNYTNVKNIGGIMDYKGKVII